MRKFKRLKKFRKKFASWIRTLKKMRVEKGRKAMLTRMFSDLTYWFFDKPRIRRLKKFPPPIVENRILFETNDDFSDNCRALFDYMIEHGYNKKYQLVWLVRKPEKYKEYAVHNVKFVRKLKRRTDKRTAISHRYVLSSRYLFYTQAMNWIGMARKNQIFINLWHGCGYKANKKGRKVFFDYVLVPGELFVETKKEFFNCSSKKILPIGYPRYDLMLRGSEQADALRERLLQASDSDKMILWLPTYRHATSERLNEETLNNEFNLPIVNNSEELLALDAFCRENRLLLIIKPHYLQIPYDLGENMLSNIVYLENQNLAEEGIQVYDFLKSSDALISDYSSVAIDYLLLDRPIGYTLDDFAAYSESRGWVFDDPRDYMPGAHIYDLNELEAFLRTIRDDKDEYASQREAVRKVAHNVCDNYCQRVLDTFDIEN